MPTIITGPSETRTISIAAHAGVVFDYVSDPACLPEWAPRFAQSVLPLGDGWVIDQGESSIRITVRSSSEHGTVDLLRAGDESRGAFMRVVPNLAGSEFMFTLCFEQGTPEPAMAAQMETIEEELRTVRDVCEAVLTHAA